MINKILYSVPYKLYVTIFANICQDLLDVFRFFNHAQWISPNDSAVYDVLTARIRALRSKVQGGQNVAEVLRGNGAKRNDLAKPPPEPPTGGEAYTDMLCAVFSVKSIFY
jgi:hypothetical protein